MKGLAIHIGFQKTGTTYLQGVIFPGINGYRLIRGWNSHRDLLQELGDDIPLISDEDISGRLWCGNIQNDFEQRVQRIATYYNNPKIIFGIRSHKSLIPSLYKQYLHNGGHLEFHDFFNLDNTGIVKTNDLHFEPKIELLKSKFKNVFIYSQEQLKNNEAQFVNDLCDFLDTSHTPPKKIIGHSNVGVNTQLQVETLRLLNKTSHTLQKFHSKLKLNNSLTRKIGLSPRDISQHYLRAFNSKPFSIGDGTLEAIEKNYLTDAQYMKRNTGRLNY